MRNEFIRTSVRTLYDMQKLRIQNGNRICASFRHKLGLDSSQAEEENEKANDLLNDLRAEYKRITDGVKRITKHFKSDSQLITTRGELALLESYEHQLEAERIHEKAILDELERTPIWTQYLKGIRGIGPLMAAVIISEVDIEKAVTVSKLYKYSGLDVVLVENEAGEMVGEGRSRKRHHLMPKSYTNRNGDIVETVGISFNPFLKTKLVGVMGGCFIKSKNSYSDIYYNYKFRLENMPIHKDKTKAHRHNMAMRYMVKQFLFDLYKAWRELEELPVRDSYAEGKLGIIHTQAA